MKKCPISSLILVLGCLFSSEVQGQSPTRAGEAAARLAPDGVKAIRNVPYVTGASAAQQLDLYLPSEGAGPWPVIVWVHGGGWQNGSKEQCPPLRSGYVGMGYAVASVNYRLSGEAVFPAQIADCKAALRWLRAHATEYHLNPDAFGAWGASAGGHLVALLGTSRGVKEFDLGENLEQSSQVQAVCDFFGPSDLAVMVTTPGYERHGLADSPESKLIGGMPSENPEKARAASPVTYVDASDPPFLIVHGEKDPVVPADQSTRLQAALGKAGVTSQLILLPGAKHGGPEFNSPTVQSTVREFFDKHLKPPVTAK